MFSRKKTSPAPGDTKTAAPKKSGSTVPSIIASDIHILGNIASGGTVDIDGRIEGNVRCHTATVRKNGHIKGDLIAENISIYGKVQGLVKARSVHFFKGCRVEGVIHHETITIEDGAFVDGRFKRADRVVLDDPDAVPAITAFNSEHPRHPFHAAFEQEGTVSSDFLHTPSLLPTFSTQENGAIPHDHETTDTTEQGKPQGEEKHSLRMLENLKLIGDAN